MHPIIEKCAADTKDPIVAPLFEYVLNNVAPAIPNLYLTLARAPSLFKAWLDFAPVLRKGSTSPRYIREMAISRVLQIAKAENEFVYHTGMAMRAGLKQAQVDALEYWRTSDAFSAKERSVLAVADEIATEPGAVPSFEIPDVRPPRIPGSLISIRVTAPRGTWGAAGRI